MKHYWTRLKHGVKLTGSSLSSTIQNTKGKVHIQEIIQNSQTKLKSSWEKMPNSLKMIKSFDQQRLAEMKEKLRQKIDTEKVNEIADTIKVQFDNAKNKVSQTIQTIKKQNQIYKGVKQKVSQQYENGLGFGRKVLSQKKSQNVQSNKPIAMQNQKEETKKSEEPSLKQYISKLFSKTNKFTSQKGSLFDKHKPSGTKYSLNIPLKIRNEKVSKDQEAFSQDPQFNQTNANKQSFYKQWFDAKRKFAEFTERNQKSFKNYWQKFAQNNGFKDQASKFTGPMSMLRNWGKKKAWAHFKARFPGYILRIFILSSILAFAYGLGRSLPRQIRLFMQARRQKQKPKATN